VLRKNKVRIAVTSFAWKLANRKIHVTFENNTSCPFCKERLTTCHILNRECSQTKLPTGFYDTFFRPLYASENDLITLWSI
jgi:hypothetical protein